MLKPDILKLTDQIKLQTEATIDSYKNKNKNALLNIHQNVIKLYDKNNISRVEQESLKKT